MSDSPARAGCDILSGSRSLRFAEDGELRIEDRTAGDLADEFGTPLYVTSEAQLRENVQGVRGAFERRWNAVTVLFATKANATLALRRILAQEGAGADCFGLGELRSSLDLGVPAERMVMNGSNKQPEELREAISAGILVNVDDPSELERVARISAELGVVADVGLRVLPFSYGSCEAVPPDLVSIVEDRSHDKWGMDRATLLESVPHVLEAPQLRLRCLHLHVSRLRSTPEPFELAAQLIAACMAELRDRYEWEPEMLDFGGGFPHERDPESGLPSGSHQVATTEQYAEALTATLREALADRGLREPRLLLEPGRRLVSNATVLLTRVGVIKRLPSSETTWVNVDASTNHCLRTSLQGYYYEIVHAERGADIPTCEVNIVGPTCVVDLIGERRRLPSVETGDVLAILDVGGYAEVLANQFNMLPRPAHVLVSGTEADVIRRRETVEDMLSLQMVPPRLAPITTATSGEPGT
jgi:diaminopimelate decarboxylase